MRKRTVMYGLVAVVLLSLLMPGFAQGPVPKSAPINPAFIDYLTKLKAPKMETQTMDGHYLGYVPSPHGPYKKGATKVYKAPVLHAPPSYFDLRDYGRVTPVRDQENCGSCWAFATYGSMESYLLTGENWDFSENNLKNTHGFDFGHCAGGHSYISTAYLSRWSGPVGESDDPYDTPPGNYLSGISPPGLPERKHYQETIWFPERGDWSQIDDLKEEIMTNGAMYIAFGIYIDYWNSETAAYYCNDLSPAYANHAVTIVGWDDAFPTDAFLVAPPGPGAFIIKNSWGTGFGEDGYFYLSYHDTTIVEPVAFHSAESTNNYSHQYSYDPLGWVYDWGYDSETAWFSNIFSVETTDPVSAVSFYVPAPYAGYPPYDYEVYVYDDVGANPTGSTLVSTKTGSFNIPGYYTVALNNPVKLVGPQFSVVVKLTTPEYGYPVGVEGPCCSWGNYSTTATSNPGESFMSPDGTTWEDVTTFTGCEECNVCLKAFTSPYNKPRPIPSFRPVAQNNINEAGDLLKEANDLLTQAKEKGMDTGQCEKLINEAQDLLAEAKTVINNPIYANNLALQALEKLKQATGCLEALLG